jgi:hypothetical protein
MQNEPMDPNRAIAATQAVIKKMMEEKQLFLKIILYTVFIVLLVTVIFYWSTQLAKKGSDCNSMNSLYTNMAAISSIGSQDDAFNNPLCEYYMKSSYNSCCAGQYENDWVQLCALTNVIKQGCRVLDFEIYNIDSKPVISVSASTNIYDKGTYNFLAFDLVMQTVADLAFSGSSCPNPNDPLILVFRIMSHDTDIYNSMADTISDILSSRVLGDEYSYEYEGLNIGTVSLRDLLGKIIIIATDKKGTFRSTRLDEYVNIAGNEPFLYIYSEHDVIYASDPNDTLEHNRQKMTICTPNLSALATNYSPTAVMEYGVQMPMMCFQTNDSYLQFYNDLFESAGHAFIRKPESMRYVPTVVETPEPTPVKDQMGTTSYGSGGTMSWDFKV